MSIFVFLLALGISLLESVTYLGFVEAHTHIPTVLIYLLAAIIVLFRQESNKPNVIFQVCTKIVAIGSTLIYFVATGIEASTYQNFIFSHTHINLAALQVFVAVSVFTYFLSLSKRFLLKATLVILIIYSGAGLLPELVLAIQPIIKNPRSTYDEKMNDAYPGFYPAMQMVKKLTPQTATIILPPQGAPWVTEGNAALVVRFLYPRTIIHEEVGSLVANPATFMLIAKGSWPTDGTYTYGWPKVSVKAQKIWQFDLIHGTATAYTRDYDPETDAWDWGLIEQ